MGPKAKNPVENKPQEPKSTAPSSEKGPYIPKLKYGNYVTWRRYIEEQIRINYPYLASEFSTGVHQSTDSVMAEAFKMFPPLQRIPEADIAPNAAEAEAINVARLSVQFYDNEREVAEAAGGAIDLLAELDAQLATAEQDLEDTIAAAEASARTRWMTHEAKCNTHETSRATYINEFVKHIPKLRAQRLQLSGWMIASTMTPVAKDTIINDSVYRAHETASGEIAEAYIIDQIAQRLMTPELHTSDEVTLISASVELSKITMKAGDALPSYTTKFENGLREALARGANLEELTKINFYTKGLNSHFSTIKERFEDATQSNLWPKTFPEYVSYVLRWWESKLRADPSLRNARAIAVDPGHLYAAGAVVMPTNAAKDNDKKSDTSRPFCKGCKRFGHEAHQCGDIDKWKDKAKAEAKDAIEKRKKKEESHPKQAGVSVVTFELPAASSPSLESQLDEYQCTQPASDSDSAKSMATVDHLPSKSVILDVTYKYGNDKECVVFEHDDHCAFHLVNDAKLGFNRTKQSLELRGYNGVSKSKFMVELYGGLGRAAVHPGPNLISSSQLGTNYSRAFSDDDNTLTYRDKRSGLEWVFRREINSDGMGSYLCKIPRKQYTAMAVNAASSKNVFYSPSRVPTAKITPEEQSKIDSAKSDHWENNHPGDAELTRMMQADPARFKGTPDGIVLWRNAEGPCPSCKQGKMTSQAHSRPSTKTTAYSVGEAAAGDLMFLEGKIYMSVVDMESKCLFNVEMNSKSASDIQKAISIIVDKYKSYGHTLKHLHFDRESAIVSEQDFIRSLGVEPELTAAGQKQPEAEVQIRIIKDRLRSTRIGIREKYGYLPPEGVFTTKLLQDVIKTLNRGVKPGQQLSPIERFGGPRVDPMRDFRADLGEIVLVHRPKRGVARGLEPKAEWGVVVGRNMSGSGVLEFYLVETKRLASRIKFSRVKVPGWVIGELKQLQRKNRIAIEDNPIDPTEEPPEQAQEGAKEQPEVPMGQETVEEAVTPAQVGDEEPDQHHEEERDEPVAQDEIAHEAEPRRYYGLQRGARTRYNLRNNPKTTEFYTPEADVLAAQIKFKQAMKTVPERAEPSMKLELQQHIDRFLYHPIKFSDLSYEERKIILNSTAAYKEKYKADGEFEKSKSRLLTRGDMQKDEYSGESSYPTARVDTMFLVLGRASYRKRICFSVDFVGAYLHSPRPEEVQHKHMYMEKEIVDILLKIKPEWKDFVEPNGRLLVEMDKMLYGYREAGLLWHMILVEMFIDFGFKKAEGDPCLLTYRDSTEEADATISTDDCLFTVTSEELKLKLIQMCRDRFKDITIQEGASFSHFGMQLTFNPDGSISVDQRKWASNLAESAPGWKPQDTPCSDTLLNSSPDSAEACDRELFRSITQSCLYAGKRTYPECLFAASVLASRFNVATTKDMEHAMRIVGYIASHPEHQLVINPGSLDIVINCDASWAIYKDRKSQSGFCLGFKGRNGIPDSYVIFCSSKQPISAHSSMESELIATSEAAKYGIWVSRVMRDLGEDTGVPMELQQDNTATIRNILVGHGTFKATKHIEQRYYAITKDLIKPGKMIVEKVHTSEMAADLLTKPVVKSEFKRAVERMIGVTRAAPAERV